VEAEVLTEKDMVKFRRVLVGISTIEDGVKILSETYEKHPELNDKQPRSMEEIIPCSLDDWLVQIQSCKEDWLTIIRGVMDGE